MPGLCFVILRSPPFPLSTFHQHSFVRSTPPFPLFHFPFRLGPYYPPAPADIYLCLSHITSTSTTTHLPHCMHVISWLSLLLSPPLPIAYSHLPHPPPCIVPPPLLPLSITHPSLTLCICYMILHHPAISVFPPVCLSGCSQAAIKLFVASFIISDDPGRLDRYFPAGKGVRCFIYSTSLG